MYILVTGQKGNKAVSRVLKNQLHLTREGTAMRRKRAVINKDNVKQEGKGVM